MLVDGPCSDGITVDAGYSVSFGKEDGPIMPFDVRVPLAFCEHVVGHFHWELVWACKLHEGPPVNGVG